MDQPARRSRLAGEQGWQVARIRPQAGSYGTKKRLAGAVNLRTASTVYRLSANVGWGLPQLYRTSGSRSKPGYFTTEAAEGAELILGD
jgi:hypothetical protein